jgi:superoxide dismutase, Cu-Zn family
MKLAWTLALALLFAGAAVATDDRDEGRGVRALAKISGCTDPNISGTISGTARLFERPSAEGVKLVDIAIRVRGLTDGKHAVHIHEAGNCAPCGAALGHFDPGRFGNSSPDANHPFHAGDLVNIDVKKGRGTLRTTTSRVTLSPGPLSIFDADGSAFIIHVNPDTYCPGGEIAGCAGGARAACGVIERVSGEADEWFD